MIINSIFFKFIINNSILSLKLVYRCLMYSTLFKNFKNTRFVTTLTRTLANWLSKEILSKSPSFHLIFLLYENLSISTCFVQSCWTRLCWILHVTLRLNYNASQSIFAKLLNSTYALEWATMFFVFSMSQDYFLQRWSRQEVDFLSFLSPAQSASIYAYILW